MSIRRMVNRLVEMDPHLAELFQQAGEIQTESEEMEGCLEQIPQLRASFSS